MGHLGRDLNRPPCLYDLLAIRSPAPGAEFGRQSHVVPNDATWFHTDAFNSLLNSSNPAMGTAQRPRIIECGTIDGVSWIHGLGYQPHIALWEDPLLLRRKMDAMGFNSRSFDAAFPLSTPEAPHWALNNILHTSATRSWPAVRAFDTTDDRFKPAR